MKGLFPFRPLVRVRVRGLNAEKLINEARKRGLTLRRTRREQNRSLRLDLSPR